MSAERDLFNAATEALREEFTERCLETAYRVADADFLVALDRVFAAIDSRLRRLEDRAAEGG